MDPNRIIATAAADLAAILPAAAVEALVQALTSPGAADLDTAIEQRIPHYHHRSLAQRYVSTWRLEASGVPVDAVAAALLAASMAEQRRQEAESIELVWTGPGVAGRSVRRTEQAILQLIDSASDRITLVSYAVYRIDSIAAALSRAAARGVRLRVIVETPHKTVGVGEYNTLRALGPEVAACSTIYFWPRKVRGVTEKGAPGLLHVKCAVADGNWLFVSSANLTQQAFTINMELGVLVRGGELPRGIEGQFDGLIRDGVLEPLT
ncbi:putative cardiolipin synthase YwiE [Pirellulimonas nuda]|uniref:Putative cardiolipin synthase YwiE n=1 Tax=Pirellulimonas nuda TaxID=2528009 RepID=A0A518DA93_9BACT|nr:DISARM system phospholipase D-like protein DrmC [Pirellulimonas nuda]QDU88402.1 putative cardiolipin synthase YwiE [Pirellulimonas nuda]